MLMQASPARSGSAHVIVLGNEKGGSGKSTTAFHIVVALLKAGQRVASIDLDSRQKTFTHYIQNREGWSHRSGVALELPHHIHIALGSSMQIAENETFEFDFAVLFYIKFLSHGFSTSRAHPQGPRGRGTLTGCYAVIMRS
ncbi:MAG: hypothetical protein EOO38_18185 [Cytophagaceae bacterium]|nr:MAG: hypothetical protein EOO38_18185 [Cytophagaceae bacterium]